MISYLRGRLVQRDALGVTIEIQGVGYRLTMSTLSIASLGELYSEVVVHTLLQIRDDVPQLFGFISIDEKTLFEKLISVSGIGPKVALSALSSFSSSELARHISEGDVARISSIPGIGKKTAQRMVLELKGVLELDDAVSGDSLEKESASERKEVSDALLGMGFTTSEIQAALKGYEGADTSTSALLRYALKRLGG